MSGVRHSLETQRFRNISRTTANRLRITTHLRFEDGVGGEVDVAAMVRFTGVFAPLADEAEFAGVRVDPELGTVVWPGGADLDPDVLCTAVTREPIQVAESRRRPAEG